jgi:hypothetical protein
MSDDTIAVPKRLLHDIVQDLYSLCDYADCDFADTFELLNQLKKLGVDITRPKKWGEP